MPSSKAHEFKAHDPVERSVVRPQEANEDKDGASPMHAVRLKTLYAAMLKCRVFQTAPRSIGNVQRSAIHEAVIAGTAIHLRKDDLVAPTRSDSLARLVQGVEVQHLFAEFKSNGENRLPQRGRNLDRIPPANTDFSIATGMALACKKLRQPVVTLMIHDQQRGNDFWRDAVKFASSRQLPAVFVVVSQVEQGNEEEPEFRIEAQEFLPSIAVDGNDVVAVYRVAEESTRRARQGLGPSLIECRVETGPDPIVFMENYLKRRKLWQESWKKDLLRKFTRELNEARTNSFGKSAARRVTRSLL